MDLSQTISLLLFTAKGRHGDEQQLDKYLANVLLATHAARFLVKVLPSEHEKGQLLKAIWMSLVATYVVQGRPKMSASLPVMTDACHQESNVMTGVVAEEEEYHERGTAKMAGMETIDSEKCDLFRVPTGRWKALAQEAIHADHQIVSKVWGVMFAGLSVIASLL